MPLRKTAARNQRRKTAKARTASSGTVRASIGKPKISESKIGKAKAGDQKIGCVIFDLDDTLYDCLGQRVRVAHRHAAQAKVEAGLKADVETVNRARMRFFRQDPILRHIDAEVCRMFAAVDSETVAHAAREAYFNCPVGRLKLFAGSLPLLRSLAQRGIRNFIVSFGEPKTQHEKVKALGLDGEPAVEEIFYADREKILTKEEAFRQIQKKTGLPSGQMLVVGDRPSSEIRAGKTLGLHTVRIRRGEFAAQTPLGAEETSDHIVRNISEVRRLPFMWGDKNTHVEARRAKRSGDRIIGRSS
jgi:FMN phosphatase YigB (HAD superfamily)